MRACFVARNGWKIESFPPGTSQKTVELSSKCHEAAENKKEVVLGYVACLKLRMPKK